MESKKATRRQENQESNNDIQEINNDKTILSPNKIKIPQKKPLTMKRELIIEEVTIKLEAGEEVE